VPPALAATFASAPTPTAPAAAATDQDTGSPFSPLASAVQTMGAVTTTAAKTAIAGAAAGAELLTPGTTPPAPRGPREDLPASVPAAPLDRAAATAAAMAACTAASRFFASYGLGWNEGVRPVHLAIHGPGWLLPGSTSSHVSYLLDGARTITLDYYNGMNDAFRPDIVEHEFSHGVIEKFVATDTVEGRALNEALADVFAVAIDDKDLAVDQRPLATGEGIWTLAQAAGRTFPDDNGGDHMLMGIATRPAYQLAVRFGRPTMARVYLTAMRSFMVPGAHSFAGFALATLRAAQSLYGAASPEYRTLRSAWDEAGETQQHLLASLTGTALALARSLPQ
jgi:hypothetical protein